MAIEIERKFLVEGDFKSVATSSTFIKQGYICSEKGKTVRVRLRDTRGYLTIKGGSSASGMSRYEFEKEISDFDARCLFALCEEGIIEKHRYLVPCGKHTYEVDEFHGENEGLIVAEVELSSEDEAFEKPSFLGKEVTGDRKYYNSQLRRYPFSKWTEEEKQH